MREKSSVESWKCIYPKQPIAAKGGGFERRFLTSALEKSVDVIAYAKLDKKHSLKIPYRDEFGILRDYEIDFLVKTTDCMYLVETKADRDLVLENVAVKAAATQAWCSNANGLEPPREIHQPTKWEYLIITDKQYEQNSGSSFEALVPGMQSTRDRIITSWSRQITRPTNSQTS